MDESTRVAVSLLAVVLPNHLCHEAWTDLDNKVTALLVNGASQTCPSPKSHQTGDLHRRCSPCTCFKRRLFVSKVVKSATCSPNCMASSLSQCHPSWGSVQTQEAPQTERGRCRAACSLQTLPRIAPASVPCHAAELAPPPAGALLLPRAGFGCGRPALARVSGRAPILFLCTASAACAPRCGGTVRARAAPSPHR